VVSKDTSTGSNSVCVRTIDITFNPMLNYFFDDWSTKGMNGNFESFQNHEVKQWKKRRFV
jgi:hypothetical protein